MDEAIDCQVSLEELLSQADIVSLHCPLTEDTRGLIGSRELGLMKRSAVLINPLLHCPNTIVTPHIAFASVESMEQRADIVFENLYAWLEGKQIHKVV